MFTSNARQIAARQAAVDAKQETADAFVALDDTQKQISMVVEAFANLDAGAAGNRLRTELAPLNTAADQASQGWIDALDTHSMALEDREADLRTLKSAESAFRNAKQQLDGARTQLDAFGSRHRDIELHVQQIWAQVSPKAASAQAKLIEARRAVAEVRSTGVRSAGLEAKLALAEQAAKPVTEGAHKHGVAATLRFCEVAIKAAEDVVAAAVKLRDLAPDTQRRLASTRTRLDGVSGRLEQLSPTLSNLRRRYSVACSADLDAIPRQSQNTVAKARDLLASSAAHAGAGRWEEAAADLDQCRQNLSVAEAGVNGVVQRLRDLDAVAADPSQEKASTRFVVRDAQALVVSAGAKVPANEVRVLDSLVERLEYVDTKLTGNYPDYWGYLVELHAIRDLATSVVRRVRAAVAKS